MARSAGRGYGIAMTQPAPRTSHEPSAAPQRALGFWMCTALVVGNIIGMGIFLLPAGLAPYGFNATLGWVITLAGLPGAGARVRAPGARVPASGRALRLHARPVRRGHRLHDPVVLLDLAVDHQCHARRGRGGLPGGAVPRLRRGADRDRGARPGVVVRGGVPVRRAHRRRRAGRDHGAQAGADGGGDRPRRVVAADRAGLLRAQPADDADHAARHHGGIHHRALRDARPRVRLGAGGAGAGPGPHHPARDVGRDPDRRGGLHHRVDDPDAADPAGGTGEVLGALRRAARPHARRRQRPLAGAVRDHQRHRRAQRLDPADRRTHRDHGRPRRAAGAVRAPQSPWRARHGAGRERPAGIRPWC